MPAEPGCAFIYTFELLKAWYALIENWRWASDDVSVTCQILYCEVVWAEATGENGRPKSVGINVNKRASVIVIATNRVVLRYVFIFLSNLYPA